jgi:hypothetical protein
MIFWAVAAVNAAMTLCEFATLFWVLDSTILKYISIASSGGTYLCEIISGVVLIWSVYSITSYLRGASSSQERLNVKTLVTHSASFGLFLIGTVIPATLFTLT